MWKYPSDIRVSENCIVPKSLTVGKTGPRKLFLFLDAEMVVWEFPEIVHLNGDTINL